MDPLFLAAYSVSVSKLARRDRASEDAFYCRFGRPPFRVLPAASTVAVIAACVVVLGVFAS
jgi:hypothetical protein